MKAWIRPLLLSMMLAVATSISAEARAGLIKPSSWAAVPGDSLAAKTSLGDRVLQFAQKYLGTPYVYAGKDGRGFDCSGFLYFVYKNFSIALPASSGAYRAVGREIRLQDARPGDVMVFTGTNSAIRQPGHVGIVYEKMGEDIRFIHCSSAKNTNCVTYNVLSQPNYTRRFLKVVRVIE